MIPQPSPGAHADSAGPPPSGIEDRPARRPVVRNPPLAQIFVCKGCCCGDTTRKRPEVPVDDLKAAWKAEKLNRSVQLTVSGCVGPCSMADVVMLMAPDQVVWLGPLQCPGDYNALVDWAQACHRDQRVQPIPTMLRDRVFHRFDPDGRRVSLPPER